ncbi:polysaccharide pyruvyl transferase family protein [Moorena bouillonii]|uniref:Succinoglycan biosynthesis ketolase n=1 Tax=Moorena bouillonii PNG TaxID=568701 RepID=A0A1U7N095_9CYAN|nr:polysaccharide pyruvyl transferase family protein [Moorena bouillonii]OLT59324.1 succinoglycan biosynthesis ketolase [Moorena bouillonii PNG]
MKLFYYQYSPKRFPGGLNNFGDDLNPWLWQQLIPNLLDDDESTAFVGIGTLLNNLLPKRLPNASRIIIFSTGVGYEKLPKLQDSWTIYCVRGPLSAKALGISPQLAVTDGAVLVRRLFHPTSQKIHQFAVMPHAKSARYGGQAWHQICEQIGFKYIDPRLPVEQVLSAISQTNILLTEAMHGAIVADALRIPWIPICTNPNILAFKWQDWCLSVGLKYQPQYIIPLWDLYPRTARGIRSSIRYAHFCFNWLKQDQLHSVKTLWGEKQQLIATQLFRIAQTTSPYLSNDHRIEQLTTELEERLYKLKSRMNYQG